MSIKSFYCVCRKSSPLALLLCIGASVAQQTDYQNPVDGKTYVAPGGWNTYTPQKPPAVAAQNKVTPVGVRLLSAQDDITRKTTVEEMGAYIMEVDKIAVAVFAPSMHKASLMVQIKSATGKTELQIARQGEIGDDMLQSFYDQVLKLKPLRISQGEILYQIEYRVEP